MAFSEKLAQCGIVYILSEQYFNFSNINKLVRDGKLYKII